MSRTPHDRRTFIKAMAGGAFAFGSSLAGWPAQGRTASGSPDKAGMAYRRLGRTGLLVSEISLGSSPLPDPGLLRAIIDRGVNYIDTSHNYDNGNAERQIGRLIKDAGRDKVHVATKFHVTPRDTASSIMATVHGSLKRLDIEAIDVLMIHGAETAAVVVDERVLEAFERLKQEGAFRFRGLSCHANQDEVVRKAVDCGLYDMVQVGYNVFDIQEPAREVETYPDLPRQERHPGPDRSGPFEGCRRHRHEERSRSAAAARTSKVPDRLRLRLPGHAEMGPRRHAGRIGRDRDPQPAQMEEDLGAAGAKLTAAEEKDPVPLRSRERAPIMPRLRRCRRACPAGIDQPGILSGARLSREATARPSGRGTFMHRRPAERESRPAAIAGPAKRLAPTASPSAPGSGKPGAVLG